MPLYAADLGVSGLTDVGVQEIADDKSEAVARTETGVTELGTTGIYYREWTLNSSTALLHWTSTGTPTAFAVGSATERDIDTINTNVSTLLGRVTSTLFSGITSLAEWLGLIAGKQTPDATALSEVRATGAGSGTYDATTDSQEAILDSLGAGSGARSVTITVNDGTTVLENAVVRMSSGIESYTQTTDVSGEATFNLDDATWTVAITKAGYSYGGTTLAVSADATATYSMAQAVTSPATDPDMCALEVYSEDLLGAKVEGLRIFLELSTYGSSGSTLLSIGKQELVTDSDGYATDEFPRTDTMDQSGRVYLVNCPEAGLHDAQITLTGASANLADRLSA